MAASVSFWASRKEAVKAEIAAEAAAAHANAKATEAEAIAAEQAEKSDAVLLKELDLPEPETMSQGDDFSVFMGRAVPEHLRRRALRKLWVSNPVLANLDGLLDHGEDYTDAATVIPGMQTAYQVGQGMMKHVVALAEQAAAKVKADICSDKDLGESEAETWINEVDAEAEESLAEADPLEIAKTRTPEPPSPRRHMRFEFAN